MLMTTQTAKDRVAKAEAVVAQLIAEGIIELVTDSILGSSSYVGKAALDELGEAQYKLIYPN